MRAKTKAERASSFGPVMQMSLLIKTAQVRGPWEQESSNIGGREKWVAATATAAAACARAPRARVSTNAISVLFIYSAPRQNCIRTARSSAFLL